MGEKPGARRNSLDLGFAIFIFSFSVKSIIMPVLRYDDATTYDVAPGVVRRFVHTENLMTVVIDFTNGPHAEPEPYHSHPHEQTCYIAKGELYFFLRGEPRAHLKAGDMFYVPSGKEHTIQLISKEARLVDSFNPVREDFL